MRVAPRLIKRALLDSYSYVTCSSASLACLTSCSWVLVWAIALLASSASCLHLSISAFASDRRVPVSSASALRAACFCSSADRVCGRTGMMLPYCLVLSCAVHGPLLRRDGV